MFWKKGYQPTIVGCELNDVELQQFLQENGISFEIVDDSTRWCAFAQYHANEHGFDIIKATSFAYMVSLFMTGMGISAGTEMYFKEEQLEYDLIDYMNQIKSETSDEEEQVKNMFHHIFEVYENNISEYEYSTERLSFKLTPSEMEKFQSIEGKTNKEKFKKLLNNFNQKYVEITPAEEANKIIKDYIKKENDNKKITRLLLELK